jgi:hypothetical protein
MWVTMQESADPTGDGTDTGPAGKAIPEAAAKEYAPHTGPLSSFRRALSRSWALLLVRIYECLPLLCPRCRAPMRIVSFVQEPEVTNGSRTAISSCHAIGAGEGLWRSAVDDDDELRFAALDEKAQGEDDSVGGRRLRRWQRIGRKGGCFCYS